MAVNIINAILNVVQHPITQISTCSSGHNRINNMGESLEEYIKDIFAGTVNELDMSRRNEKISECFSYLGNQNNPPDSILRGGDAIEVKKINSYHANLALNSSYPKAKIYASSTMITQACRDCEQWTEKDLIYAVGVCNNEILSSLCLVYGVDYAASAYIYDRIKTTISSGVQSIPNVEFAETRELGRVNRVDPLGITYLRIRGMWGIENPMNVFNYVYHRDEQSDFNFMVVIDIEKYYSFYEVTELESLAKQNNKLIIKNVNIKTPDNPAVFKKAKLITFTC